MVIPLPFLEPLVACLGLENRGRGTVSHGLYWWGDVTVVLTWFPGQVFQLSAARESEQKAFESLVANCLAAIAEPDETGDLTVPPAGD